MKLSATFLDATGVAVLFATSILPIFKAFGPASEQVSAAQVLAGLAIAFVFQSRRAIDPQPLAERGVMNEILFLAVLAGGGLLVVLYAYLRGAILDRDMGVDPPE